MPRNTDPHIMKIIYDVARMKYLGAISNKTGVLLLKDRTPFSKGSIEMYFDIYTYMRNGRCYKKGTSADFTRFLIENIFIDNGKEAMLKALAAAKMNSDYRIKCDNEQPGIKEICLELIEKYNLNIKYDELDKFACIDENDLKIENLITERNIQLEKNNEGNIKAKITIGVFEFSVEGPEIEVRKSLDNYIQITLPTIIDFLNNDNKGSNQEIIKKSQIDSVLDKNVNKLIVKKYPDIIKLKSKNDIKGRMIPILFLLDLNGLKTEFTIKEVEETINDVLGLSEDKKAIESVFERRADWFLKTKTNPKTFKLSDVAKDFSRNTLKNSGIII